MKGSTREDETTPCDYCGGRAPKRHGIGCPLNDNDDPIRASFRDPAWLKRGVRFRAFPTRTVRQADGTYVVPTYRVTATRRRPGEITIYYCDDADGRGKWSTSLTRLQGNGLEILP